MEAQYSFDGVYALIELPIKQPCENYIHKFDSRIESEMVALQEYWQPLLINPDGDSAQL